MINVLTIANNAFDPSQACLTITSLALYEMTDTCLNIYKEKNMQNPLRLNILYILTNVYGKNQVNNMFYRMLYRTKVKYNKNRCISFIITQSMALTPTF